ncbi:MAG: hypothetical protein LCH51_15625 [Bacteroidetes bacterium]|nr:hypothetical protein [Bacteroidota bacterium]
MKKYIPLFTVLTVITVIVTSFRPPVVAPKLYPELEAYFKAIDAKQYPKEKYPVLENLRQNINATTIDNLDWNCIFYCTENSFRSQASQVFLATLSFDRRFKRVKAFSAGITAGEINPKLIEYLSKIGYKITKIEKDGKVAYEVKYSDGIKPILLYTKTTADPSLPKQEITSVVVCDRAAEPVCKDLKTPNYPFELPFQNVNADQSDLEVESTLKNIAIAMKFLTEKKAPK